MNPHLFLDIDGVANNHVAFSNGYNGMCWDNVAELNRVTRLTRCRIVVSSAWRYNVHSGAMTLGGLVNLFLSHGLDVYGGVVVGITRRDISADVTDRGQQIAEYVRDHGIELYAVVDDGGKNDDGSFNDLGITAAGHPVVWTDGKVGLTRADADKLVELLT